MRGANKVTASKTKQHKTRVTHAKKRQSVPMSGRKQNLSSQKVVGSKMGRTSGQIHELNDGVTSETDAPIKRTPIEQALINWRKVQSNVPWWWLSFSKQAVGNMGVCVVQGDTFLGAVNRANKLGVSVPGAAVYGEELSDMSAFNDGMVDRLLSEEEAGRVFKSGAGCSEVSEVELYKARENEVKFRAAMSDGK